MVLRERTPRSLNPSRSYIWLYNLNILFDQKLLADPDEKTMATFAFFFSFRCARSNESIYVLWTIYNIYTVWTIYSIRSFWQILMKKQWRRLHFFSCNFRRVPSNESVCKCTYSELFKAICYCSWFGAFEIVFIKWHKISLKSIISNL